MANRLSGGVVYLLWSLVILQPTVGDQLDSECIKRYSVSYKRPASQISSPNQAKHVVDGDETTCSNTMKSPKNVQPWWQVNLDVKTNVSLIQIKNSRRRITAFRVYVRKDINSGGTACPTVGYHVFAGGETRIIRCDPMLEGRAIRIVGKEFNDRLSLCEVQVFNHTVLLTEGVTYDVWFNETNPSKGFTFVNTKAHSSGILASFQSPRDISDYYGVRMKTYFNPPESGNYTFNMSGDNKCNLYIKDVVADKQARFRVIGKIPRDEFDAKIRPRTPYDIWNEAYAEPVHLTESGVYEIIGLMYEVDQSDHLRVGVTYPNGTFVGPMDSRIFINEDSARTLAKNSCPRPGITIRPSFTPSTKPPDLSVEHEINSAVAQLLNNMEDDEEMFQILKKLERLGFERAKKLPIGERPYASYVVQVQHFVFAAVSLDTRHGFNFPGNLDNYTGFSDQDSISFPKGTFLSGKGHTSVVFMMFQPLRKMSEQTGHEHSYLSSNILSATLEAGFPKSKIKPFTLVFRNTKVCIKDQRHCVFWIEDPQSKHDSRFGRWSDEGCSLVHENETHTTCRCNHLTKFAVLFPFAEASKEDEMKIELITYVGLSLSSIGCLITFTVYLILRITKTSKAVVHLNLVLALGLADIIFLLGNLAESNKNLCLASTILSFYLYLAVFAWMLMEGVHLYFLIIRVFGSDDYRRKQYYHIIGWGAPFVIVSITAGILRYDLMSEKHCWLSTKSASIWVFVGPALFVVIVNILILAAVLRTTMTLLRNDPGHRKEKSAMRTLAMLVPILGTTWVFGVMMFANDSIVFQYIFAACNAFQGFFIFILYCLFNTEVRHEYQRRRKAWRTERELDSKRSPHNNSFDL